MTAQSHPSPQTCPQAPEPRTATTATTGTELFDGERASSPSASAVSRRTSIAAVQDGETAER